MASETGQATKPQLAIPDKVPSGEYPLIDNDPYGLEQQITYDGKLKSYSHISRVIRYARPSDWAYGAAVGAISPGLMLYWEKLSPSFVGKGGFAPVMRLSCAVGVTGAFLFAYSRSSHRFYGARENRRELEMDMREMTDKVKRGEPLYGTSGLTEYMQGVAHRNSRYASVFSHVLPWPNFVHHPYHGVDTAKYYRQAELELEQERLVREGK